MAVNAATRPRSRLGRVEFTTLLAFSMSLAALGIDIMLPAFGAIRSDLGLPSDSTRVAGTVTTYFLGLALGQIFYGPVSDRFGRKPALYVGYGIYLFGAIAAAVAPDLGFMLVVRFVWGLGAAGPRVVTLSVVRDRFEGEAMSRAMSFIMAVFILVPVMAPSVGALILTVASWRWVFGFCAGAAAVMALWASRLAESLHPDHRMELRFKRVMAAGRTVVSHRQTLGYTLALTALMGVFTSYLASSEIIFGEVFGIVAGFPLVFGGLAAVMGAAMLTNAGLVRRIGTRRMAHGVLVGYVAMSAVFTVVVVATAGRPSLSVFLVGLAVMLSAYGLLLPNLNTIAMQPMAAVAGTAAAVIGTISTAVGAGIGFLLDRSFDGTVIPLTVGFAGLGLVALSCVVWAEKGVLFGPLGSWSVR